MTKLLALMIGVMGMCALAQASEPSTVPLWGRFEATFEAATGTAPFSDLVVEFTSPSGKTRRHPGFYDGGQTYRVRFMPIEEGVWRYRTSSPAASLSGQSGSFTCQRGKGNRFLEHGPLRVSADGTHLVHADGTPFFLLADTVWNGPLLSKDADWPRFLNNRLEKKFTGIQFVLQAPWRTAYKNLEGQESFTGRKDIVIHPEAFKRMDERMAAIESAGMISLPVLIWACTAEDPGRYLPEEDITRLVRYQVARYSAHHVIWILVGDGRYVGEAAERWKRVGRAAFGDGSLFKRNYKDRAFNPVILHPGGQHWPFAEFRQEPWMDLLGYQSGHGDNDKTFKWTHSGPPSQEWMLEPVRPVVNLEPCYEDHFGYQSRKPMDSRLVRQACYWSLLNAPAAGLTYGAHGIWSWEETEAIPLNHKSTGLAKPWHVAMNLAGSSHMKIMAEVFTALPWWTLRPDATLLETQPGENEPAKFVGAARSADGSTAVFYLPVGGEITIKTEKLAKDLKAEWIDPRTGHRSAASFRTRYVTPSDQDWVLVLRR